MKTSYTLFKMVFALTLLVQTIFSSAQVVEFLNSNNLNAGFGIGGNLFSRLDSSSHHTYEDTIHSTWKLSESPKGGKAGTIYTASLWMSGLDAQQGNHCAGQRYAEHGHDFYDGPIVSAYTSEYDKFYTRVFKITHSQIVHHVSLGVNLNASQIDSDILFWPAKGNPFVQASYGVSISSTLAPFIDVDHDQIYDPSKGDCPAICGDEAVFFVYNDIRGPHNETMTGDKLGFEIRGLAEVYLDTTFGGFNATPPSKRAINNTVFVNYEVENKSQLNYYDFYLGLFEDVDLGCFSNDRVGIDTNRSLMYVYNGSVPDPDCQNTTGYGQLDVASGTKKLLGGFSSFAYFTNGAAFANSDPTSATGYRNYLSGLWNDGTPYTVGAAGSSGSAPTKYVFPGDPNNPADWSEVSGGNPMPAGDRRMMGSYGPISFAQGETKSFDYAFITSFDSSASNLTIVDTLKRDATWIQGFYDANILGCRANPTLPSAIESIQESALQISVYPNPANSSLFVESPTLIEQVDLTDVLGRTVLSKAPNTQKLSLDVSLLAKGLYVLKVKSGSKTAVKKIVVE